MRCALYLLHAARQVVVDEGEHDHHVADAGRYGAGEVAVLASTPVHNMRYPRVGKARRVRMAWRLSWLAGQCQNAAMPHEPR